MTLIAVHDLNRISPRSWPGGWTTPRCGMRLHCSLLIVVACALSGADAPKVKAGGPSGTDLKSLMCERGALLFEEHFTPESFAKNWTVYKGDFTIADDHLKAAEVAANNHHPEMAHTIAMKNGVVQVSFRFDGAKWLGVSFDSQEHVSRVMLTPDSFTIVRMSGMGGTTKGVDLDRAAMKFEPRKWYTLLIETHGDDLLAQIDNDTVLYGSMAGVGADKKRIDLIAGGATAWFDDLKVWEATPNKTWSKRKSQVIEMVEARKKKGGR